MEYSDDKESGYAYCEAENVVLGEELLHCNGNFGGRDGPRLYDFNGLNNKEDKGIAMKAGRVSSLVAYICDRIRPFWYDNLGRRRLDRCSAVRMLPNCGL